MSSITSPPRNHPFRGQGLYRTDPLWACENRPVSLLSRGLAHLWGIIPRSGSKAALSKSPTSHAILCVDWQAIDCYSSPGEHPPPRTLLLCGQVRRDKRCGAEHALRHSTACGERSDHTVGGVFGCYSVYASSLCAHSGRRRALQFHQTVFRGTRPSD